MAKKKISFDIEVEDFEKIKKYCLKNNIKQGEFLRGVINNFLNANKSIVLTIFTNEDGKFKKWYIDPEDFEMKMVEVKKGSVADENFGAKKQGKLFKFIGKLSQNKDNLELIEILKNKEIFFISKD